MSDSPPPQSASRSGLEPPSTAASNAGPLPPVQPPSPGFLMQLFVVPMVIVTVIVLVCLMFNWLAHLGTNPQDLVDDLSKLNAGSWQKALTIANVLCDRHQAEARRDPLLAQKLAQVLDEQLKQGSLDSNAVKLRVYLALALGVFEVDSGLDVLQRAAELERGPAEIEVRRTAMEAIARRVDFLRQQRPDYRPDPELVRVVMRATEPVDATEYRDAVSLLRTQATYTLAVLGGDGVADRLLALTSDADPMVRFNAATGLARLGDSRALPHLQRMLDVERIRDALARTQRRTTAPDRAENNGEDAVSVDETVVASVARNAILAFAHLVKADALDDLSVAEQAIRTFLEDPRVSSLIKRQTEVEAQAILELIERHRQNQRPSPQYS